MSTDRASAGPPLGDFADGPVGLGERLDVEPSMGTTTLTVPLPFAADRTGATPPISLVYAGGGNGPVGLGWSLAVPSVERVGDRGLPRHDESDRFVLAGIGPVSPALAVDGDGSWQPVRRRVGDFTVHRHVPVDGHPVHVIERWVHRASGVSQWRVEGPDGTVALYGATTAARLADPADPARITTWYLERSWDVIGNAFVYDYKAEDLAGVSAETPAEAARIRRGAIGGRYLKQVRYANRRPFDPDDPDADIGFRLQVVLDYGEHDLADPATADAESQPWPVRPDPVSRYQGFEVRTYRRCGRVLLFNRYPGVTGAARLTDVVALDYGEDDPAGSRLRTVERRGHRAEDGGWWLATAPLSFTYAPATPAAEARLLEATDGRAFTTSEAPQWVDVFGEGIRHLLYRRLGGWAFRPNRGDGRIGPEVRLDSLPSFAMAGVGALGDVEADGSRDLVVTTPETAGFHPLDPATRAWDPMLAFDQVARLGGVPTGALDCSGDGSADALVGGQGDLVWIESDGAAGDRLPQRLPGSEDGPPQIQSSPGRGIFLLDMNGDGLADVVRVRNGEITYWPSLGHGHFAAAVTMTDAPRFDHDERFDPLRLRFVDLDGSGTPDLLYLGSDQVMAWTNQAGNGFGPGRPLRGLPGADSATRAEVVDLLVDGTACLVWTSTLPHDAGAPVRYLPLMTGGPPGRLVGYANGRGGEVRLEFGSSARMYLDALDSARPWPAPLSMHPTVVTRVERTDHVTGSVTNERFGYHDPVTDPDDGSLVAFTHVERHDTAASALDPGLLVDGEVGAAVVRTWYHPGERADDPLLAGRWQATAFAGDPAARCVDPSAIDVGAFPAADRGEGRPTWRAAMRALAGRPIRQEVYAAADLAHPYQVSETRWLARPQQPAQFVGAGRRGATAVEPSETLIHVYDGAAEDPRIEHTIHLDVDRYGRDQRLATVAYGRRTDRAIHPDQQVSHVTVEEATAADLTGGTAAAASGRSTRTLGVLLERRRYDLVRVALDPDGYLTPDSLRPQVDAALASARPFDADLSGVPGTVARLTEWERHTYLDARDAPTDDGAAIEMPVRLAQSSVAAFPRSLVTAELPAEIDDAELIRLGYQTAEGYWWRPGPRRTYRPAAEFHLLRRSIDPFGAVEELEFDDELRTLTAMVDAAGLRTSYDTDYVSLEPMRRTDPNDVVAEVRFDPLRRVRCRAVRGRTRAADGSTAVAGDQPLAGHAPAPTATMLDVVADPAAFVQGAAAAAHYDDLAWYDHVVGGGNVADAPPTSVTVATRSAHERVDPAAPIEVTVSHYDGSGSAVQRKRRVTGGRAFVASAAGVAEQDVADRWLCTGRSVPNDKGLPMQTFAPLHTDGPAYEPHALFAAVGVGTRLSYDPMGRLVRTDSPAGFHTEAERSAWAIRTFDENDTIERSHAFTVRLPAGEITDPATVAAIQGAREHRDTPTVAHLDAKGRPFLLWASPDLASAPMATYHRYTTSGHTEQLVDPRQVAANTARGADDQVASVRFVRDMQGVPLVEESADAGADRLLVDALARPVHRWDARGVHLVNTLDLDGRVTEVHAKAPADPAPVLLERYRYGAATTAGAADRNQRGRLVEVHDQAGRRTMERYDHEGRALETVRRFVRDYRGPVDWSLAGSAAPGLETDVFRSRTTYDALGRLVRHERPDGSVQHTEHALGGTVASVRIEAADGAVDESFLTGVTHDVRGHRAQERHGNGMTTALTFDRETARLRAQITAGPTGTLAEVAYGYDPVGNVTERDNRTRRHLITNLPAVPAEQQPDRFRYDAAYRLVEASGWTHEALTAGDSAGTSAGSFQGSRHLSLNDGQLLCRYRRRYRYDLAGNLEQLRHTSAGGNFTRTMWVDDRSNRSVTIHRSDGSLRPDPAAAFDATGNLSRLDRLRELRWDHHGRLAAAVVIARPAPDFDDAEYYVHGSDGLRARKVEERLDHGQRLVIETRYFTGCSITRRRRGTTDELERRTAHADVGPRRLGFVHHWTRDTRQLEVDAPGETAVRYVVAIEGGHSHLVVDEQAAVVTYEEHAPFGDTTFVAGDRVRDLVPRRDRFAGRERDDVTGFVVFPFRSYAPWLCRWVSPDPLGTADGPNRYLYVHDNPLTHRDDLGLETEEERRQAEMDRLVGQAVPFESLPADVQERTRASWLTASQVGATVYVYIPGEELHRIADLAAANRMVEAGDAIAIHTIDPQRARTEEFLDSFREALRGLDDLTAPPSPYDLDEAPSPRPIGSRDQPGGSTDPAAESTDGPDVPGVSVRAATQAAELLPDGTPSTTPAPADRVPNELPDEAQRWGDSEAARRDLLERPEFRDGQVPAEHGNTAPEGVRPDQIDPHGPAVGEYGHVAQHGDHHSASHPSRQADYLDPDNPRPAERLTEREHGAARGQLEELSHVPEGDPQYSQSHYDNDVTVWTERETALNKTHANRGGQGADNPTTRRMAAHRGAGGAHDFTETFGHARDNYHRAITDTGSTVSPRSADVAVFHQMSNASGMNTTAETAARLPSGAADDIDDVLAQLDASDSYSWAGADAPRVPDAPSPTRGARALGGLRAGGRVALEALGPLGTGMSVYAFATATTTEDRILTGADLGADLIGYAGPVGATFSISYGVTRAVDEGIGWASREYLGTDLAPSSVMADGMVSVDQAMTSLWADPSRPAYTQTVGWKLAEFFDSF